MKTPNNHLLIVLFIVSINLFSCTEEKKEPAPEPLVDFCSQIHIGDSGSLQKELAPLATQLKTKTGVYPLEDGDGAMIARAWLSEHAEKSIDIQYFIFSTDNVGLIACDYIVRAANRGIKVRILLDDIMVEATPHDVLMMDAHENIDIKVYNPGVKLGKSLLQRMNHFRTHFIEANQRMHNKTFIVDDVVGITGGRNIADEYFDYDHEYNFRDRDVLLLGKTVGTMKASFEQFWKDTLSVPVNSIVSDSTLQKPDPKRYEGLHQYACNPGNFWPQIREEIKHIPQAFKAIQASGKLVWSDSVQFISDVPGKFIRKDKGFGGGLTTLALMKLVKEAKHSVIIQSPYLITTDLGTQLFAEAVKRGVEVKILTNSLASTDNLEAFAGYQKCRNALLKAGVRIFEFKPDARCRYDVMTGALQKKINFTPIFGLHAKSMVVDGYATVIGTFNLDPRSANFNTECFALIYSKPIANGVLQHMETEFKPENAWETTLTFNPDKLVDKKKQFKAWTRKAVPKGIL